MCLCRFSLPHSRHRWSVRSVSWCRKHLECLWMRTKLACTDRMREYLSWMWDSALQRGFRVAAADQIDGSAFKVFLRTLILPCRSHLPMSYGGQLHFGCILRWTALLFTVFIIAEIVHKIKQSVFARLKKKCCWNVKEIYMCLLHFYEKRSIIFIKQKSFL